MIRRVGSGERNGASRLTAENVRRIRALRDEEFDVVTTGYGIRNVPDITGAIAEMRRVLKPGGALLSLDFNRPLNPLVRGIYLTYLTVVGSTLGLALHRDPDTYRYIPESIRRYPGAVEVNGLVACGAPGRKASRPASRVPLVPFGPSRNWAALVVLATRERF